MRRPRSQIVDPSISLYYHVTSRCVRDAFLLDDGDESLKPFVSQRPQQLHEFFAVDTCGFGLMDNHMHLVLRLNPEEAARWTDRDVAERWAQLHPPRDGRRCPIEPEAPEHEQ